MQKKTRNSRENTQAMKPNSTQRFWESSKKSEQSSKKSDTVKNTTQRF